MQNLSRIENNPYRILGIYVGSPLAVEINHLNRIRAFTRLGQTASFKLRGDDMLNPILRTGEMADAAAQTLSLVKDRVENSLLWFGDADKEWGCVLNNAVQGLIEGDYTKAINSYDRLISNEILRENFLTSVTHGLLKLSMQELAVLISEIISSCEDDLSGYWLSKGDKPSGYIARILFDNTISDKIDNLIQSIENRGATNDFYELLDQLNNILKDIKPLLERVGDMYEKNSIQYNEIAVKLCKKLYARGSCLIMKIGQFIWLQNPKNRTYDNTYKEYKSKMPVGCIKACMDLILRVDNVVNDTVVWLGIDEKTKRILYPEINTYESIKKNEFVDNDNIIRHAVRSFQIKRAITILAWLGFLFWIFLNI